MIVMGTSAAFGFVQPLNDLLPERMGKVLSTISYDLGARGTSLFIRADTPANIPTDIEAAGDGDAADLRPLIAPVIPAVHAGFQPNAQRARGRQCWQRGASHHVLTLRAPGWNAGSLSIFHRPDDVFYDMCWAAACFKSLSVNPVFEFLDDAPVGLHLDATVLALWVSPVTIIVMLSAKKLDL